MKTGRREFLLTTGAFGVPAVGGLVVPGPAEGKEMDDKKKEPEGDIQEVAAVEKQPGIHDPAGFTPK